VKRGDVCYGSPPTGDTIPVCTTQGALPASPGGPPSTGQKTKTRGLEPHFKTICQWAWQSAARSLRESLASEDGRGRGVRIASHMSGLRLCHTVFIVAP
jgi:hypothetical protein